MMEVLISVGIVLVLAALFFGGFCWFMHYHHSNHPMNCTCTPCMEEYTKRQMATKAYVKQSLRRSELERIIDQMLKGEG